MRINAHEATYENLMRYSIRVNGIEQHFCRLFDTDLGIAEFDMYTLTKAGNKRPLVSYGDEYDQEGIIHGYTLHTFEVWDNTTNMMIVKV